MADKPIVTQDLVKSILELRNETERRLMRNKYYLAMRKLDELLEVLRPLEAEVIEEGTAVLASGPSEDGRVTAGGEAAANQVADAYEPTGSAGYEDGQQEAVAPTRDDAYEGRSWERGQSGGEESDDRRSWSDDDRAGHDHRQAVPEPSAPEESEDRYFSDTPAGARDDRWPRRNADYGT